MKAVFTGSPAKGFTVQVQGADVGQVSPEFSLELPNFEQVEAVKTVLGMDASQLAQLSELVEAARQAKEQGRKVDVDASRLPLSAAALEALRVRAMGNDTNKDKPTPPGWGGGR
jgi:hypothetical protein